MKRAFVAVALASLVAGCRDDASPRAQWVVALGTDAPVPQFGDRVLIEVLDETGELACPECRRQLSASAPEDWPISFGVTPPEDGGTARVRARLFRAANVAPNGLPDVSAVLDATARLPATRDAMELTLNLEMSCFGVSSDPFAALTCDPASGSMASEPVAAAAAPLEPGSWPLAEPKPCSGPAPEGMVCVPGGAFLLGDATAFAAEHLWPAAPERLVRISPFFMDVHELSVGVLRELAANNPDIPELPGSAASANPTAKWCTFLGLGSSANDDLPLSCVSQTLAGFICDRLGKRLPTEAEWEWAAGNRERESTYPWGEDDDVCAHAITGRAEMGGPTHCRAEIGGGIVPAGPAPVTRPDVTDVTETGLQDMAGNVAEWTADEAALFDDACWSPKSLLLEDPSCVGASEAGLVMLRGGAWSSTPYLARTSSRTAAPGASPVVEVGLRCAK